MTTRLSVITNIILSYILLSYRILDCPSIASSTRTDIPDVLVSLCIIFSEVIPSNLLLLLLYFVVPLLITITIIIITIEDSHTGRITVDAKPCKLDILDTGGSAAYEHIHEKVLISFPFLSFLSFHFISSLPNNDLSFYYIHIYLYKSLSSGSIGLMPSF